MENKEEVIKEFIQEFCNDHNGEIRFLRSVFWDEKDGAEQIISFLRQALSDRDTYWLKKIEEGLPEKISVLSELPYGAACDGLPKKYIKERLKYAEGWNNCLSELKKRLLK